MIEKYISEKIVIISIYYKKRIYFKNYSNNYKTWWSTQSYITYEFIVSFQLYMKNSTHVISQKNLDEVFHSKKCKCVNI